MDPAATDGELDIRLAIKERKTVPFRTCLNPIFFARIAAEFAGQKGHLEIARRIGPPRSLIIEVQRSLTPLGFDPGTNASKAADGIKLRRQNWNGE